MTLGLELVRETVSTCMRGRIEGKALEVRMIFQASGGQYSLIRKTPTSAKLP